MRNYRNKICVTCEIEFKPITSTQLTCLSKDCVMKLRRESKNRFQKRYHLKHKSRPEYICKRLVYRILDRIINHKDFRSFSYMPFTKEEFINDIESKFLKGMSWDNYGEWHIDHKRPLCTFNFINSDGSQNKEEINKANSLTNLQPLWAIDNMRKHTSYDYQSIG